MAGPPKGKEAKKVNEKVVRRGGNDDVDPEGEDANNGCGNDADRTDDNNGWCGAKPKKDHSNSHSHGTKDTGSHGTKDTGSHGTKDPGSHGTKDPVPPPGDGGGGGGRPILT